MTTTLKTVYGTAGQAITCLLAALANAQGRASTAIDNTTNLALDALVSLAVKTGASGVSATGYVSVYAYGTVDGTTYTDGVSGTDGNFTPSASGGNLRLIGTIQTPANATTYQSGPFSVANAFGGVLPEKWGIVVVNNSGAALDATEANHSKLYQLVNAQSV